jgi:hypothetical protein
MKFGECSLPFGSDSLSSRPLPKPRDTQDTQNCNGARYYVWPLTSREGHRQRVSENCAMWAEVGGSNRHLERIAYCRIPLFVRRKISLTGYVACMEEKRNVCKMLVREPEEKKRSLA